MANALIVFVYKGNDIYEVQAQVGTIDEVRSQVNTGLKNGDLQIGDTAINCKEVKLVRFIDVTAKQEESPAPTPSAKVGQ